MTTEPHPREYFSRITARERINDLVHKVAKGRNIPYPAAWKTFVREFRRASGVDLFDVRGKGTVVDAAERLGMIPVALLVGHQLAEWRCWRWEPVRGKPEAWTTRRFPRPSRPAARRSIANT